MKGTYLGEFEEIVMLSVAILQEEAYGYAIAKEIEDRSGRKASLSALHTALHRLEKKGVLASQLAGATTKRGGKRRRFFIITIEGKLVLQESMRLRKQMWEAIPKIAWNNI